ncbi:zinc ABC transporter substrate-binding protein [Collinsella sp. AGMB00827]|uniref:Zinc ABC transporter substrate-binding protein n=1 Tax=Collinsella ureilytica TaxID=2869515 RepID=A0ABS7MJ03_9ACTN|nr:zinc ABC transporter substrate-binding protein [Collinsella urealyticum]MBY4797293.1 zinc ABC transporter substrate-binding protein [Collinsella urealyticum]
MLTRRQLLACGTWCAAALGSTMLSGCGGRRSAGDGTPLVYASFYPILDLVHEVAGDSVELRAFMPANKDPHAWEPTPKVLSELSGADLLVVNGANMEHWLPQVQDALPDLPILRLSDDIELITYKGAAALGEFQFLARMEVPAGTYGFEFGHTHESLMRVAFFDAPADMAQADLVKRCRDIMADGGRAVPQRSKIQVEDAQVYALEMGHESGHIDFVLPKGGNWVFISDRASEDLLPYQIVDRSGTVLDETQVVPVMEGSSTSIDKITYDPHSWLSLVNAKRYCNSIHDCLLELMPNQARLLRSRKLDVVTRLTELEYEYVDAFAAAARKEFVVTHYAWAYLCRDFGLIQYPLQGLTSMDAPSLKTMRKAIDYCITRSINTIFYELGASDKGAKTIADEIGGTVAPLASMEFVTEEQGRELNGYVEIMRSNLSALLEAMK